MAVEIFDIADLIRAGADVGISCLDCTNRRTVSASRVWDLFHNRGWSTLWGRAARRFRCGECGSRRIQLNADFYAASLKRQQVRQQLRVIEGGRRCPKGVDPAAWEVADHYERLRLIREARNR